MSIYGIGAYYEGTDVAAEFLEQGVACLGWQVEESPTLHQILKSIKIGDIIYIKKCPPNQHLRICAIGVVNSNEVRNIDGLGSGIGVAWLSTTVIEVGQIKDRYPIRTNSLYEEFNPTVINAIIDEIRQ